MKNLILILFASYSLQAFAATLDATEVIKKADQQLQGKSSEGTMRMEIESESGQRTLKIKFWRSGSTKSLVKILEPVKDKGTGNLKIDYDLWQYLPNVDKTIKIPPSMMLQSWMGSDFSNDDLVKASSIVVNYKHKVLKELNLNGENILEIECLPKEDAPVVWGKIVDLIRKKDFVLLKRQFYSEKGELLKEMTGENVKTVDGHTIATKITMITKKKPKNKTILYYEKVSFDKNIDSNRFTQQTLRKPI